MKNIQILRLRLRFWLGTPAFFLFVFTGGLFVFIAIFVFGAIAFGPDIDQNPFFSFVLQDCHAADCAATFVFYLVVSASCLVAGVIGFINAREDAMRQKKTTRKIELERQIFEMRASAFARREAQELAVAAGLAPASSSESQRSETPELNEQALSAPSARAKRFPAKRL